MLHLLTKALYTHQHTYVEYIGQSTRQLCYYVGHQINSDNDLISQKLLLKSEFYYPLHVAICVTYSCLKYVISISSESSLIVASPK